MRSNNVILFLLLMLVASSSLVSCGSKTYAQMLQEEANARDNFIKNQNFEILSSIPADTIFKPGQFYKYTTNYTNFYISILDRGNLKRRPIKGCQIVLRYKATNMDGVTWLDYINNSIAAPVTFRYLVTTASDLVYQSDLYFDALEVPFIEKMIGEGAVVQMIVPSKMGPASGKMASSSNQTLFSHLYEVHYNNVIVFN